MQTENGQEAPTMPATMPQEAVVPVVYHKWYNIALLGLEAWSRLNAWKLHKVYTSLVKKGVLAEGKQALLEKELTMMELAQVHRESYLVELEKSNMAIVRLTEVPALLFLPNFLNKRRILAPLRLQASGTVYAVELAIKKGWAINLGGGMTHASHDHGAAWCPYDDITLAIRMARNQFPKICKVMIIDFGARQGNGYANNKIKSQDQDLIIVDVYNEMIFPQDFEARKAINIEKKLLCGDSSETYMKAISTALTEASQYKVDLILYAAGTNVLEKDYSGQIRATEEDVIHRDERVFRFAKASKTPVCMVTSSGYGPSNHEVVSASIENVLKNVCN